MAGNDLCSTHFSVHNLYIFVITIQFLFCFLRTRKAIYIQFFCSFVHKFRHKCLDIIFSECFFSVCIVWCFRGRGGSCVLFQGRQSNSFHSSNFFQIPNNQNTTETFGKYELARYCFKKCSKWENQNNFFRPPKLKKEKIMTLKDFCNKNTVQCIYCTLNTPARNL